MTTQPPESKSLAVFSDGISAISYLPRQDASLISSTSWDGSIHIHDTVDQSHVLAHQMEAGPLLSLAVPHGMDAVACGGLDGAVRLLDIPSTSSRLIGRQGGASVDTKNACSCLESLGPQLLVSAGWSKKLFLWDVRQSTPISELDLPGKAFSMDMDRNNQRVVVATSGRRICFYDIRKGIAQMALERESSLKFQTRAVKFFPEGKGIVLGSIEGRVGVEFLAELGIPAPMKRYAFKCHRVNDTVYPVNAIAFHPKFNDVFATGGCDGSVFIWDAMKKKKLTSIPSLPTSISSLAFNHDGSEIAIASSYTHEEGDRDHPQDEIFIRKILESECQKRI